MLFNSYFFWLFYAVVFVLYHRLAKRGQNWLLLIASYFFYGCWDWRFLTLIAASTLIDYLTGLALDVPGLSPRRRKAIVSVSLVVNLGFLGFFKYYNFFAGELTQLLTAAGVPALLPTLNILLPVGISFYTFQSMSYTIDVYRGNLKACRNPVDFALFVSFFPQLVAGPIERATDLLPQVTSTRVLTPTLVKQGLYLIAAGMFRKVVVADNMAPIADAVFATPATQLSGAEILLGIYAFAFQIYGDFSGYSSIARGVANLLGFDLMANFRNPYFAISPSDFWQRWHISLSQWLRDYLYIPLGGNRHGSLLTYRNLLLTMLLGGFWHGANWTFLAWGAFHGGILCLFRAKERASGRKKASKLSPLHRALLIVLMFHLICFSWLLFRAETMGQVWEMMLRVAVDFTITPFAVAMFGMLVFYVTPLMLYEAWLEWKGDVLELLHVHWLARGLAYSYVVYMMMFFPPPTASEFIYFQF